MTATIAQTPEPPYFAVIFTSLRTAGDQGYDEMAERMAELAARQPGFLGIESARSAEGLGVTVSYWESEKAIAAWKAHAGHRIAQAMRRQAHQPDSCRHRHLNRLVVGVVLHQFLRGTGWRIVFAGRLAILVANLDDLGDVQQRRRRGVHAGLATALLSRQRLDQPLVQR